MKRNIFLFVLILVGLTSCQYPVFSGTMISDEKIDTAINLKFSKNELEDKFGSPNIIPDYSPNTWYYIHRDMTRRAFFTPKVVSQRVVKVTFKNDYVDTIDVKDNEHNSDIKIVKEFIRSKGSEKNPVQEYLQNFGKFNKHGQKEKRR